MLGFVSKKKRAELRKSAAEARRDRALEFVHNLVEVGRMRSVSSDGVLRAAAKVEDYLAAGVVPSVDPKDDDSK
jgi:hypothetical protein